MDIKLKIGKMHCASCAVNIESFLLKTKGIKKAIKELEPKVVRWSGGEPFLYLNKKILERISSFKFPYKQIVTASIIAVLPAPFMPPIR